jgi:tetratricopeptide (TPR) repeat protein
MDFAARANDMGRMESLRARAIRLPEAGDSVIVRLAEQYRKQGHYMQAHTALTEALDRTPDSQKLLMCMAEVCEELGRPREAMVYYNRAVKAGFNTIEGREADKRLSHFTPVLTDRERGSFLLALREAFGFGLFFLLLVWQDAGLDLAKATSQNWIGLALGVAGGYLLVTATSSPRQTLLARLLGGLPPEDMHATIVPRAGKGGALEETSTLPIIPEVVRWGLGVLGAALLIIAIWFTFEQAIRLLLDPVRPDMSMLFGQ